MSPVDLRLSMRAYDHLTPLFLGNVEVPGVNLILDQASDLMATNDRLTAGGPDGFDAAEVSFNRFVIGMAKGDDSLMGLPAFILRNFRHRCWYVRRDSALTDLGELKGKRVGTDSWNDTGTMWSRAAMRDAGVEIADVRWVFGKLSPVVALKAARPGTDSEPAGGVERLPEGRYLLDALADGEIDALTTAATPEDIYKADGRFRRLVVDYPAAEADFHRRRGFRPGLHIIAARRDYAERHPQALLALYKALHESWAIWWAKMKRFADSTPWAAREVEIMLRDFTGEMPPYGLESDAHRKMIAYMCEEQFAQGLVPKAADPEALFSPFYAMDQKG